MTGSSPSRGFGFVDLMHICIRFSRAEIALSDIREALRRRTSGRATISGKLRGLLRNFRSKILRFTVGALRPQLDAGDAPPNKTPDRDNRDGEEDGANEASDPAYVRNG